MAIATAVQRGMTVYVYNERGSILCTLPTSNKPGEGLKGYTGSTVSVQRGMTIYVHNEKGSIVSTISAGR